LIERRHVLTLYHILNFTWIKTLAASFVYHAYLLDKIMPIPSSGKEFSMSKIPCVTFLNWAINSVPGVNLPMKVRSKYLASLLVSLVN